MNITYDTEHPPPYDLPGCPCLNHEMSAECTCLCPHDGSSPDDLPDEGGSRYEHHALIIPVVGLMDVLHSNLEIEPRSWLEAHGGGTFVSIRINRDHHQVKVAYLLHPGDPPNPRAIDVLARLTGVFIDLTGNVAFIGLEPEEVVEVLSHVG